MSIELKLAQDNILNDNGWKFKLFILSVLTFIAFLPSGVEAGIIQIKPFIYILSLFSLLLASRYCFKYMNNLINKPKGQLPEWENFPDLFWIGLKYIIGETLLGIIMFVCAILPITIFPNGISIIIFLIICMFLLSLYPAVLINFSEELAVKSMFEFKKILSYAQPSYFKALTISGLITIVAFLISVILYFINVYLLILAVFINLYAIILSMHLLVQSYHEIFAEPVDYGF